MQTIEAIIDTDGMVRLLTDIRLPHDRRAILTILDEEPKDIVVSKKDRLLRAFKEAQKADLFKDIDDPSEWQRNLRNEWE